MFGWNDGTFCEIDTCRALHSVSTSFAYGSPRRSASTRVEPTTRQLSDLVTSHANSAVPLGEPCSMKSLHTIAQHRANGGSHDYWTLSNSRFRPRPHIIRGLTLWRKITLATHRAIRREYDPPGSIPRSKEGGFRFGMSLSLLQF